MNKKGGLQDIVLVAVILLFFATSALVGFKVTSEFNDFVQTNPASFDPEGVSASQSVTDTFSGTVDNTFLFFAVGLGMVVLALALMVRVNPIFIPFYIIGLIVVIFVCGILSNIYQEMAADANLLAEANQLLFISNVLELLPLIVGVFGTLMMIVLYKRWRIDQDGI